MSELFPPVLGVSIHHSLGGRPLWLIITSERNSTEAQAAATIAGHRLHRVLGGLNGRFRLDGAYSAYYTRCNEVAVVATFPASSIDGSAEAPRAAEAARAAVLDAFNGKLSEVTLFNINRLGAVLQMTLRRAVSGFGVVHAIGSSKFDFATIQISPDQPADDASSLAVRAANDITAAGHLQAATDALNNRFGKADQLSESLRGLKVPVESAARAVAKAEGTFPQTAGTDANLRKKKKAIDGTALPPYSGPAFTQYGAGSGALLGLLPSAPSSGAGGFLPDYFLAFGEVQIDEDALRRQQQKEKEEAEQKAKAAKDALATQSMMRRGPGWPVLPPSMQQPQQQQQSQGPPPLQVIAEKAGSSAGGATTTTTDIVLPTAASPKGGRSPKSVGSGMHGAAKKGAKPSHFDLDSSGFGDGFGGSSSSSAEPSDNDEGEDSDGDDDDDGFGAFGFGKSKTAGGKKKAANAWPSQQQRGASAGDAGGSNSSRPWAPAEDEADDSDISAFAFAAASAAASSSSSAGPAAVGAAVSFDAFGADVSDDSDKGEGEEESEEEEDEEEDEFGFDKVGKAGTASNKATVKPVSSLSAPAAVTAPAPLTASSFDDIFGPPTATSSSAPAPAPSPAPAPAVAPAPAAAFAVDFDDPFASTTTTAKATVPAVATKKQPEMEEDDLFGFASATSAPAPAAPAVPVVTVTDVSLPIKVAYQLTETITVVGRSSSSSSSSSSAASTTSGAFTPRSAGGSSVGIIDSPRSVGSAGGWSTGTGTGAGGGGGEISPLSGVGLASAAAGAASPRSPSSVGSPGNSVAAPSSAAVVDQTIIKGTLVVKLMLNGPPTASIDSLLPKELLAIKAKTGMGITSLSLPFTLPLKCGQALTYLNVSTGDASTLLVGSGGADRVIAAGQELAVPLAVPLGKLLSTDTNTATNTPLEVATITYCLAPHPPLVKLSATCRYTFLPSADSAGSGAHTPGSVSSFDGKTGGGIGTDHHHQQQQQQHKFTDVLVKTLLHPAVPPAITGAQLLLQLPPPLVKEKLPPALQACLVVPPPSPTTTAAAAPAYSPSLAMFRPPTVQLAAAKGQVLWNLVAAAAGTAGSSAAPAAVAAVAPPTTAAAGTPSGKPPVAPGTPSTATTTPAAATSSSSDLQLAPGRTLELKARMGIEHGVTVAPPPQNAVTSPVVPLAAQLKFSLPSNALVPVALAAPSSSAAGIAAAAAAGSTEIEGGVPGPSGSRRSLLRVKVEVLSVFPRQTSTFKGTWTTA